MPIAMCCDVPPPRTQAARLRPAPVNVRNAQPFWNPDLTLTLVRFFEPSTVDEVVSTCVCESPLRIDRTVDSQHSEFAAPLGGSGEKSDPEAVALCSSRLKNVKPIGFASSAGGQHVGVRLGRGDVVTNWFFSGWVMTQSVSEALALSSTYSFDAPRVHEHRGRLRARPRTRRWSARDRNGTR